MEQERVENAGPLQNDENQFDDADPETLTTQDKICPIVIKVEPLLMTRRYTEPDEALVSARKIEAGGYYSEKNGTQ
ncbi:3526_t:CDS:2, partial [Gigaspora rosea]